MSGIIEYEDEMPPVMSLGIAGGSVLALAATAMRVARFTESPIETLLGVALLEHLGADVVLRRHDQPVGDAWTLTPQLPWRRYRVDWALRSPTGAMCFIECDGQAFHSSSEQIVRDARRDEEMQAAGFQVFRFTGSEIDRSAHHCAAIVVAAMQRVQG